MEKLFLNTKWPNEPMDPIPMPAALLSCLLLFPVGRCISRRMSVCLSRKASARGQESRQKQVVMGHAGRSSEHDHSDWTVHYADADTLMVESQPYQGLV
jgi:hypothetical protein